jgi:hypothetical protein
MLRYFVIQDGQRFGPADLDLLQVWARQGRLTLESQLEEDLTGRLLRAGELTGLQFAPAPRPSDVAEASQWSAPPIGHYPRSPARDDGASELTASWICSAVGLFFCFFVLPIVGLVYANKAAAKGNPGAGPARIFAIAVLLVDSVLLLALLAMFGVLFAAGAA